MALSSDVVKSLMIAATSQTRGNTLADAINTGTALQTQTAKVLVGFITATDVSQTVDFGSLLAGDVVVIVPALAGNAQFVTIATAGDLGQAAVIGSLYLVLRSFVSDAASAVKF